MCLLSGKVARMIGASISTTLTEPQKYVFLDRNPILSCLVDQTINDLQWKGSQLKRDQDLANEIIQALEEGTIQWPSSDLVSKSDWIANMKAGFLLFYRNRCKTPQQLEEFEFILLTLASELLNRTIKFYQFNVNHHQHDPKIFNSKGHSEYFLLGCTSLGGQNFFISLKKQPKKQRKSNRKCILYYKTF